MPASCKVIVFVIPAELDHMACTMLLPQAFKTGTCMKQEGQAMFTSMFKLLLLQYLLARPLLSWTLGPGQASSLDPLPLTAVATLNCFAWSPPG